MQPPVMVFVESDPLSASTVVDSAFKPTTLVLTTPPAPTISNEDEEDICPVCYEPSPPTGDAPTKVACEVCKHAICSECDKMLTVSSHVRCPMCRAPRPIQPLPPLRMAIHAFHCTDPACETPQCADAKLVLLKVQMHALNQECVARELRCSGAECKVCKLWRALINNSPPQEIPQEISERLRLRLRELPPEQVKRMLMAHVRQCRNRQCATCRKTRERLALRLAHQRQAVAS